MTDFDRFADMMNELESGNFWEDGIEEKDFRGIMSKYSDIVKEFEYDDDIGIWFILTNGIKFSMNEDEGGAYYWYLF